MKASLRWLREICPPLPDDAPAVAERLTAAGIEVEGLAPFGLGAEACVVATVVSVRPHPSRIGLRLVTVETGKDALEIVCGAPNVPDAGGLVVLAPLGAHLPAKNMTIDNRSIAGVSSAGMLCSEAEVGLGDDGDGILVLPAGTAKPGSRFIDAAPAARDTILEINLTPNRPDALGHLGIAREAAALFGVPFVAPDPADPGVAADGAPADRFAVTIEDRDACPHYASALLEDVRVMPSPAAVRWRLASLGVRPISNVVDVTNLVMLEFGHPMHAFDLERVRGLRIVVRRARAGEALRTLDGVERTLSEDDVVVCDGQGPLALAGVMGGEQSEITSSTRRILLECAYFDPRAVRRSARRHGLHTESSHRFERGVDWGDTRAALGQAVLLSTKLASAVPLGPLRVVEAKVLARPTVKLHHERLCALLGAPVDEAEGRATLERLGFTSQGKKPGCELWEVPSFRPDVLREVDLIEEVGRVRGYDSIVATLPPIRASRDAAPRQGVARRAREAAVAVGLSEAVTYSFVSVRDLAAVGAPPAVVTLRNAMSSDHAVMRTSLLPGLLRALSNSRRHGQRSARLFTVGPLFMQGPGELPDERIGLSVVVAGEREAWLTKPQSVDVWDAKGLAQAIVQRILRRDATLRQAAAIERPPALHPRGAAWVDVDGERVGSAGPIHPDVADAFDVDDTAVIVEVDLMVMLAIGPRPLRFSPLPRFPATTRDLAVIVADDVRAGDVEQAVRDSAGELAERVTLFDRFTGGMVPAGHTSLALHVVYRAADRTLTDAEVDARHVLVVSAVEKRFGATLRS